MQFAKKVWSNKASLILIVMFAYIIVIFFNDFGNLSKMPINVDYYSIPLIIAPMILAIFFLGVRYNRYLRTLGVNIRLRNSIAIYTAGLSFLVTPASSGQVVKSNIIKKRFGIPISRTAPVVLVEKWNELVCAIFFLIILVIFHFTTASMLIIGIGIAASVSIYFIMRNYKTFEFFRRLFKKFSFLKVYEENIETSRNALEKLTSKKMVLTAACFALPSIILQAFSVYFGFQSLGIEIDFLLSSQIFYISLVSGILAFIPGGLGVTEGSMLALLLTYTDENPVLLSAAVLFIRLITLWFPTGLGLIVYRIEDRRTDD